MLTLDGPRQDIVTELINIGVGNAAAILNGMLDCHIELTIPRVDLIEPEQLPKHLSRYSDGTSPSSVRLGFSGGLTGDAVMVFPQVAARRLVALLAQEPEESPDIDFLRSSTITEVGNIVLNGVVGSLTNILDLNVTYELPYYSEKPLQEWLAGTPSVAAILLIRTRLKVREQPIEGDFLMCLQLESALHFLNQLDQIQVEMSR